MWTPSIWFQFAFDAYRVYTNSIRIQTESSVKEPLDTIVFQSKEHRKIQFNPCQIQLVEIYGQGTSWSLVKGLDTSSVYLRYTEDVSKNYPSGLTERKVSPKTVILHANRKPSAMFCLLVQAVSEHVSTWCSASCFLCWHQHASTPTNHLATLTWLTQLLVGVNRMEFRNTNQPFLESHCCLSLIPGWCGWTTDEGEDWPLQPWWRLQLQANIRWSSSGAVIHSQ